MPVPVQTPIKAHVGNGVSVDFAFDFFVELDEDMVAKIGGAEVDSSLYTIAGLGDDAGGTVTFLTAPANLVSVVLLRRTQIKRDTNYQTAGDFRAQEVVNPDFDRLWRALQDFLAGNIETLFALRVPSGETIQPLPPASERAETLAGFDSVGGSTTYPLLDGEPGDAASTVFIQAGAGAVGRTAEDKLRETISAADFGVYVGAGTKTAQLQAAIDASAGKRLILRSGVAIAVNSALSISDDIEIDTDGQEPAYIDTATNSGIALEIGGAVTPVRTTALSTNTKISRNVVQVANATDIEPGDLLLLRSTKAWYHDPREELTISPDTDATGTAQAGGASTITLKAGTTETSFAGLAMTITSGTGVGQARVVQSYVSGTKVCTMTEAWKTVPDNTSVYRFPQLFKGELHLVKKVVGNVITLDIQTMDGYDVVDNAFGDALEDVVVTAYRPIRASLKNVHIRRPATLNANSFGIKANFCLDLTLDRVRIDYGQASGIALNYCYRSRIVAPTISGSNDTTTGYGIQDTGGTFNYVIGGTFYGCRRGVDFSGTTPSSFGMVAFASATGGGAQEDGADYTPEGVIENYGFGSHGSARNTTYYKNRITSVSRGINLRGRNEKIIGNEFYGHIDLCCIDLYAGCNEQIADNHYYNQWSEGSLASTSGQIETNDFSASNINLRQVPYFIRVQTGYERGATDIFRNTCRNLNRYFLFFDMAGGTFNDFTLSDNVVRIEPNDNASECALVGVASGTLDLPNFSDTDNDLRGTDSITNLRRYGAGVSLNRVVGAANSRPASAFVETLMVADDTVGKVRVGRSGTFLNMLLYAGVSIANRFFGALHSDGTLTTFGGANNVEGIGTVPTGTSGTDGVVSLHFSGDFLYIENRSGGQRDFFVTIYPGE